jgi:hypothetical protein
MSRAFFFLTGALVFFSCVGEPPKIIIKPGASGTSPPPREEYQFLNYQGAETGGEIPEWVSRYLEGGSRNVERMEFYRDSWVFVGNNRGTNFKALGHWAEGFTAAQDFPRLAAVRIEERLLGAASLYPDDEYGEFFEALVKKASDAVYTGAIKESVFWVLRRQDNEETASARERYDFFVLVTIAKSEFQAQVHAIMEGIHTNVPPTRDQTAAINRIKETFFDLF